MNTDNNYIVVKVGTQYYIPRSRMIEDLQQAINWAEFLSKDEKGGTFVVMQVAAVIDGKDHKK